MLARVTDAGQHCIKAAVARTLVSSFRSKLTRHEGDGIFARVSKGKNKKNKHEEHPSPEKQKLEPIYNLPIGPPKRIHMEERSEPPILASRGPSYTRRSRIAVVLLELRDHFIATLALISLGSVLHFILTDVWGDPRFFDELPVRYVIDAGDIAVIATFFIIMIIKLFTMDGK